MGQHDGGFAFIPATAPGAGAGVGGSELRRAAGPGAGAGVGGSELRRAAGTGGQRRLTGVRVAWGLRVLTVRSRSPSGSPGRGHEVKMSSGRKADTSMLGASTSWLILRSTATLQMA
jgi:hypothetical protein